MSGRDGSHINDVQQRKAARAIAAYGFPVKGFTESDCVAELMKLYQAKVDELK